MIKNCILVGAGAGKEAKLPTGHELKEDIARLLDMRFDWNEQKSGDYDSEDLKLFCCAVVNALIEPK